MTHDEFQSQVIATLGPSTEVRDRYSGKDRRHYLQVAWVAGGESYWDAYPAVYVETLTPSVLAAVLADCPRDAAS